MTAQKFKAVRRARIRAMCRMARALLMQAAAIYAQRGLDLPEEAQW